MTIKVIHEINLGGVPVLEISWEKRRRTFFTSNVSYFGNFELPVMSVKEFEADKISYSEEKRYSHGKCYIRREWCFIIDDGIIIASEREERPE